MNQNPNPSVSAPPPGEPKRIMEELYNLIDNLDKSGLKSPNIKIFPNFDTTLVGNLSTDYPETKFEKRYSVEFDCKREQILKFTVSESSGVWGIDIRMEVSEILRLVKEEVRNLKIDNLLK